MQKKKQQKNKFYKKVKQINEIQEQKDPSGKITNIKWTVDFRVLLPEEERRGKQK